MTGERKQAIATQIARLVTEGYRDIGMQLFVSPATF